jgi:hypothetical protein
MAITAEDSQLTLRFKRYYQQLTPALKKPKMQASTAAVFSFLAVSLFLWYAVRPTAQTIIYLRKEIADKTDLNKRMEDKITALIEAQANYENAQSKLPLITQALPGDPDGVIIAKQLRNLASAAQASISAMQIPGLPLIAQEATPGASRAAPAGTVSNFPITMVVKGPYAAIRAFLTGLLNMRRIVTIETLSLKQETKTLTPGEELQLSVRLKSYYSTQ